MPESDWTSINEGLRVLVVEDDFDSACAIAKLLARFGYTVKMAGTVGVALQLLGSEGFDVIVSDITLPDGSGYELMEEIKKQGVMKGIAMSGYDSEDDVRRSQEAGFARHLVKPVSAANLDAAIRGVVGT